VSLAVILVLAVALAIGWRLLRLAIRVALLIALIAAAIVSGTHPTRGGRPQPAGATTGRVIAVIDGDTLTIGTARGAVRARLLGIDAPEGSALRYGRPDCGGQAATDALRRLAQPGGHGVRVRLLTDPRSGDVKTPMGAPSPMSMARTATSARRSCAPARP
jgi:endonuclease YncB( thermonuclease family)